MELLPFLSYQSVTSELTQNKNRPPDASTPQNSDEGPLSHDTSHPIRTAFGAPTPDVTDHK